MFLNDITDKEIISSKTVKGYCRGVGISLKSHAVKYLLCASNPLAEPDFAISAASVENIGEQIRISSLRPLSPKNCVRIFIGRPVYAFDGVYLGNVADLDIRDFVATELYTDQNACYPISSVTACFDAVILKKQPPYPIGQRIPAPLLPLLSEKKSPIVTKPVLRAAIRKSSLIKFTLSLPPFSLFEEF